MGNRWTERDLKKLAPGMVKGLAASEPVKRQRKAQKSVNKDKLYLIVWAICKEQGLRYESEYKFHHKRQFRFDMAIPEKKIAIEYEGIHSDKSGHTTVVGYNKDSVKYNLALTEGWRVLRYTSNTMKNAAADILKLLNNQSNG